MGARGKVVGSLLLDEDIEGLAVFCFSLTYSGSCLFHGSLVCTIFPDSFVECHSAVYLFP